MNETTYRPAFLPSLAEILYPQMSLVRDIGLVLVGSGLMALLAHIEIPLWPVPITGQTFGVLLIGAMLGSRRGALAVMAYLVQGALGLPVFAPGGAPGLSRFAGPTGGYLLGFVIAAFVVGWLSERGWDRKVATAALAMLAGNVAIYLFGLPWLARFVGWQAVLSTGLFPFILGDLLKIGLAALTLPGAWFLAHLQNSR
ncbi:MAG TPA: biotin transporter BioY [Chloroflexi bacterium]|nr:biotin transporter BioY [Chloroflexota bacterium]